MEAEKEVRRAVILNPQRIGLAEERRQDWVVNAEENTTVQDVMDPQYWAHMAQHFSPYDRIDVRLETGEWLLELLVISVGRNWASVHLCQKHDLQPVTEDMPTAIKHKVEWKGPQIKHAVIRIADSEILQSGFAKKNEAIEWMVNHEKVTASV